jgi:heptosyltransferase-2
MKKILIIQTAFIGDVILATAVVEKIKLHFPDNRVDFLLRKGNESLLDNNPQVNQIIIWNKKESKYRHFLDVLKLIRSEKYDLVLNLQRFSSSGLFTVLSQARTTIGFDKNPLSFLFSKVVKHEFGNDSTSIHEVERNLKLIEHITDASFVGPKLYPSKSDFSHLVNTKKYITISPGSVWFTKQWPAEKWIAFLQKVNREIVVYLLGGQSDKQLCTMIAVNSNHPRVNVKAGEMSFLQSAALMKRAVMNFVNDSAPLHLASSVNAPVTAVFCSTVPYFGFTPLSDNSSVLETREKLRCRPCGLHGKKKCPQGHFKCSEIEIKELLDRIK